MVVELHQGFEVLGGYVQGNLVVRVLDSDQTGDDPVDIWGFDERFRGFEELGVGKDQEIVELVCV